MITLMPHVKPGENAHSLTDADLHEQIAVTDALARVLEKDREPDAADTTWLAQQMWIGYELRLAIHGMMCAHELVAVRRASSTDSLPISFFSTLGVELEQAGIVLTDPPWIGDLDVHRSHRSQLIARNPAYTTAWPRTPVAMPVLWPQLVDDADRGYRLRLAAPDLRKLRHGTRSLPEWLRYDEQRREVVEA